jgi:hypothetical protein
MNRWVLLSALVGVSAVPWAAAQASPAEPPAGSVQVEPGLYLPARGTVWVFDSASPGAAPIRLYRTPGDLNHHYAKNLAGGLAGSFLYRPSVSVELAGAHAQTRLTQPNPVFYIREAGALDGEEDMRPGTEPTGNAVESLTLVRLKSEKHKRVEVSVSTNGFGGGAKRKMTQVMLIRDDLKNGWLKLTPAEPLEPGEYALVAVPHAAGFLSQFAYDFGVDAGPKH